MTEVPKEAQEFLNMVRAAELKDMQAVIRRNSNLLAQGVRLRLFTINSNTQKVLMTFEARFHEDDQIELKLQQILNWLVGKEALVVF